MMPNPEGYLTDYIAACVPALLADDLQLTAAVDAYVTAQAARWQADGLGATMAVQAATVRKVTALSLIKAVIATGQTRLAWGECVFCKAVIVEVFDVQAPEVLRAGCRFCQQAPDERRALTDEDVWALTPLEAQVLLFFIDNGD